jgi:son of sevenless-like protein
VTIQVTPFSFLFLFCFAQILFLPGDLVRFEGQNVITRLYAFLLFVANIHVARHVDIDGINQESGPSNELYVQSVEKARVLVRTLEAAVQILYDDGTALLMTTQGVRQPELSQATKDQAPSHDSLTVLCTSLKANTRVVKQTLEALLSIGHHQSDMSQGDYNGSIEWRMSRMSMIDNRFPPSGAFIDEPYDPEGDVVDMEIAFSKTAKNQGSVIPHDPTGQRNARDTPSNESDQSLPRGSFDSIAPTWGTRESITPTVTPELVNGESNSIVEDDGNAFAIVHPPERTLIEHSIYSKATRRNRSEEGRTTLWRSSHPLFQYRDCRHEAVVSATEL